MKGILFLTIIYCYFHYVYTVIASEMNVVISENVAMCNGASGSIQVSMTGIGPYLFISLYFYYFTLTVAYL